MKLESARGYAEEAADLLVRYEKIPVEKVYDPVLGLIPPGTLKIVDIGAGTGQAAAWFAARGDRVVAVEPVDELREGAQLLHPDPSIEWVDDGLPHLRSIETRKSEFDVVWLSAVWFHLDTEERAAAMPVVASLMKPSARLFIMLRHGPVPAGRRMFEVSAEETIELAACEGLKPVSNIHAQAVGDFNRRAGVTWTHLVLEKT
ncbi:MAG: class I SAM-dependent methyltransferase [Parvularculaceae bacterium]